MNNDITVLRNLLEDFAIFNDREVVCASKSI